MKYTVLIGEDDLQKFENLVNQYIEDGWEPQGGVSLLYFKYDGREISTLWYAQAMIKRVASE